MTKRKKIPPPLKLDPESEGDDWTLVPGRGIWITAGAWSIRIERDAGIVRVLGFRHFEELDEPISMFTLGHM